MADEKNTAADDTRTDERPLAAETIIGKFRDNAGRLCAEDHVQAVIDAVLSLDAGTTPAGLAALLSNRKEPAKTRQD